MLAKLDVGFMQMHKSVHDDAVAYRANGWPVRLQQMILPKLCGEEKLVVGEIHSTSASALR